jgi:hypothetical protein
MHRPVLVLSRICSCPRLLKDGRSWNERRLLIFTEWGNPSCPSVEVSSSRPRGAKRADGGGTGSAGVAAAACSNARRWTRMVWAKASSRKGDAAEDAKSPGWQRSVPKRLSLTNRPSRISRSRSRLRASTSSGAVGQIGDRDILDAPFREASLHGTHVFLETPHHNGVEVSLWNLDPTDEPLWVQYLQLSGEAVGMTIVRRCG